MNNKILVLIVAIIIVFVASGYFINKNKIENEEISNREQALQEIETKPKTTLDVKHQYKEGKHILVGMIQTPTPCHSIEKSVTKNNAEIFVNLKIVEPEEGIMCAQVITDKPYYFEFEGNENDSIYVRLNNEEVNLNIFEVPADKKIEDIEIYIKG